MRPFREPFASVEIRFDAERLVGEERARAWPTPVCTVDREERADLARDLGRGLDELPRRAASRRPRPAPARAGHRKLAAGRDGGLERLDVVRPRERDPGHERAEALPLRGLAGREGTERPAVEAALERDFIRERPVAFRATLSAASFASAPELQKNACAPPTRSERSAASRSIGSVQ